MKPRIKSCYITEKLWKNVLRIGFGIGNVVMSYKDYALTKLYTDSCFLTDSSGTGETARYSTFVGIVTSDFTLSDFIGFFDNDDHAAANGVVLNQVYYLSRQNTYGLPFGMPKKLVEPLLDE